MKYQFMKEKHHFPISKFIANLILINQYQFHLQILKNSLEKCIQILSKIEINNNGFYNLLISIKMKECTRGEIYRKETKRSYYEIYQKNFFFLKLSRM